MYIYIYICVNVSGICVCVRLSIYTCMSGANAHISSCMSNSNQQPMVMYVWCTWYCLAM